MSILAVLFIPLTYTYAQESNINQDTIEQATDFPSPVPVSERVPSITPPDVEDSTPNPIGELSEQAEELELEDGLEVESQTGVSIPTEGSNNTRPPGLPNVDEITGALNYKYEIDIPPSRDGMSPNLSLVYNSQNKQNAILGISWTIDIPYIQRLNKKGTNSLYTNDYFTSSIDGELITITSSEYQPKIVSGNFSKYEYDLNSWTVTDKEGTVYKFGNTAPARQENITNTSEVYKWMLEEVRDTNNNYIKYEYFKDAGQIYPSVITYTGNGPTNGVFKIFFDTESRSDVPFSYAAVFKVETKYRISEVRVEVDGVWIQKYDLGYTVSDNTMTSVLDTITQSSQDEQLIVSTLPAIDFGYLTAEDRNWTYDESWDFQFPFIQEGDSGLRLADINGDGLIDVVCSTAESGKLCTASTIKLNTGSGFGSGLGWEMPFQVAVPNKKETFLDDTGGDRGLRLVDVNGDGLPDLVRGVPGIYNVYINDNNIRSDYLNHIKLTGGGEISVAYTPTTQFKDILGNPLNPNLQVVTDVVSKIEHDDGLGNLELHNYEYEGGEYYFASYLDRKFSGFGIVTSTDSDGNVTKTYFHQGNETDTALGEFEDHISKAGRQYRIEEYDDAGNLYRVTINKWDRFNIGLDNDFVKLARSTTMTYDGDGTHKDIATEYVYDDTTGNVLEVTQWGEVNASDDGSFTDTGSDKYVQTIEYAANLTTNVLGLPSHDAKVDQSGSTVTESVFYYDNLAEGQVDVGNLTKEEHYLDSTNKIDVQRTYNSYGLVTSETDPNGNTTSYVYDSFNLYPETVTNALGHTVSNTYDYSSGQIKETTDPNGNLIKRSYDGLDRPILEERSDLNSPVTLVTVAENIYDDQSFPTSVHTINHLDSSNSVDSYTYFDGLGREAQIRVEAEDPNTYSTKDTVYDNRGLVEKESLPYFDSGSSYSSPTINDSLYTQYSYDALDRVLTTTNSVGSSMQSYDDWNTTITNANGVPKDFSYDAYGNLISVIEHDGPKTYSTDYEYDGNSNLTRVVDALGNERSFTYDFLGKRLSAEDLHAPSDPTYGVYTYGYDNTGNLTSQVDPNGITTNYTYDVINRITKEDSLAVSGTDVVYRYDTCTSGVGLLCTVRTNDITTSNTYFPHGLLKKETSTISGQNYGTSFTYDRQNNLVSIQYPQNKSVTNSFNTAGLLESIDYEGQTVLFDTDYAPTGAVTYQEFGKGVDTFNTYDSTQLYRLSSKSTTNASSTLQDLSYTYDAVGNITKIIDASDTNTAKVTNYKYDDLDRLTRTTVNNSANGDNYTRTFRYNAVGNITNKSDQGQYSYRGHQGINYANPHAATDIAGTSITYDNNGNLLTEGTRVTNTWDYRNRLASSQTASTTVSYLYDNTNARISYDDGSETTIYPNQYMETTGGETKWHIYAGDIAIATAEEIDTNSNLYYTHTDHLNSSSIVTDNSGSLSQLLDYYPFGSTRIDEQSGTFDQTKRYTGHEYDDATNYTYANARYINTDIGRFISQDPIGQQTPEQYLQDPQQFNMYSYARNNPLILVDRTGEISELVSRTVTGKGLHLYWNITPDNPEKINIDGVPAGTKNFTIGAYNRGGILGAGNKLVPEFGYEGQSHPKNTDYPYLVGDKEIVDSIVVTPSEGVSDTDHINALGAAANQVQQVDYSTFGQLFWFGVANSNNFAYEIGLIVGVEDQVSSFNSEGFNWAPGQSRGLPDNSIRQSVYNGIDTIKEKISESKKD